MAQSRRSSRSSRTSTQRVPTKSSKSVTFDLETEQELLTSIEEFLSESSFSSFSDLCKHVVQQYMQQAEASPENGHVPGSDATDLETLGELKRQIAALEERLQSLAPEADRLNQLESDLVQLASRVDALAAGSGQATPSQPAPQPKEADPVLARLGPLLEDF